MPGQLRMRMDWRSLQQKSCASITPSTSESSVVSDDSTTFMVPLVSTWKGGRRRPLLLFVGRRYSLSAGTKTQSNILLTVDKIGLQGASEHRK
ncbi:hypothetical protein MKW98_030085 [Papaver atlanticum]|uniref:Uncharacterized protein n=1 Tax=Papaver atlanticum TaxID=357466 RepID=A0AAD4T8S0_9MAGN|nr:hypothetical protein MKW98_030085 [Papaver atlanticum]